MGIVKQALVPSSLALVIGTGVTAGKQAAAGYDSGYAARVMRKAEPYLAEKLSERKEKEPKIDTMNLESCKRNRKECKEDSEDAMERIETALSLLESVPCSIAGADNWAVIVRKSTRTIIAEDNGEFCEYHRGSTDTLTAMLLPEITSMSICILTDDDWRLAATMLHEAVHNIQLSTLQGLKIENDPIYNEICEVGTREQAYEALAFSAVIALVDDYERQKESAPWFGWIFKEDLLRIRLRAQKMLANVRENSYGI